MTERHLGSLWRRSAQGQTTQTSFELLPWLTGTERGSVQQSLRRDDLNKRNDQFNGWMEGWLLWYLDTTVAEYNRCKSAGGKILDMDGVRASRARSDGESTWVVTRGRAARFDGNGASDRVVRAM